MKRFQFTEDDDLIDICYDNVFKAVFTRNTPESQGALSKLVSALIDREVLVTNICTNEPPVESLSDRQIRYDINCKTESGELINVEMSLNPKRFEPVKLEYYAAKLFIGQDIRGVDKSFKDLKQAYQIAILAKEHFFPDESLFHCFEHYDPARGVSLNGRSRIITLELAKLEKVVNKPIEGMNSKEHWAYYFKYLTDKGKRLKINKIMDVEEGIAMASEVLINVSKDEIERAHLMSKLKYELETQSDLVEAKREGILESQEKIARNALAEGASIEFVQKITGLTAGEIEKLQ